MSSRAGGRQASSSQHTGTMLPEMISQPDGIDIDIRHIEDDVTADGSDVSDAVGDEGDEASRQREKVAAHTPLSPVQQTDDQAPHFSEDSRPMFSPVPAEFMEAGETSSGSPQHEPRMSRDAASFPSIHVDSWEKSQGAGGDEPQEFVDEAESPASEHLRVPSPLLYRKTDGRVVLMTQDSNRKTLGTWSLSEGDLPEALRRCPVHTPFPPATGRPTHLDVGHQPEWVWQTATRGSSDVALNELRKERDGRCPSPGRLTAHLQPLSSGSKVMSTSSIQTP